MKLYRQQFKNNLKNEFISTSLGEGKSNWFLPRLRLGLASVFTLLVLILIAPSFVNPIKEPIKASNNSFATLNLIDNIDNLNGSDIPQFIDISHMTGEDHFSYTIFTIEVKDETLCPEFVDKIGQVRIIRTYEYTGDGLTHFKTYTHGSDEELLDFYMIYAGGEYTQKFLQDTHKNTFEYPGQLEQMDEIDSLTNQSFKCDNKETNLVVKSDTNESNAVEEITIYVDNQEFIVISVSTENYDVSNIEKLQSTFEKELPEDIELL